MHRGEPLASREVVEVDIELRASAPLFRAGEELRLDVGGHWPVPATH